MTDCGECPLSLSCWSGALLGKESSRVAYPKNVNDRAVWQDSVTMCPVCEQLCVITYKYGQAVAAFEGGAFVTRPYGNELLRPGDTFSFNGVDVAMVTEGGGTVQTVSTRGQRNDGSSPLDGQDFTFERHDCAGRKLNEWGWTVWYRCFMEEGPLAVVQECDSAPSAHSHDKLWSKLCPLCLNAYLNKLTPDDKVGCLYIAPKSVMEFNMMHPTGHQLRDAMLETKSDIIAGWKP